MPSNACTAAAGALPPSPSLPSHRPYSADLHMDLHAPPPPSLPALDPITLLPVEKRDTKYFLLRFQRAKSPMFLSAAHRDVPHMLPELATALLVRLAELHIENGRDQLPLVQGMYYRVADYLDLFLHLLTPAQLLDSLVAMGTLKHLSPRHRRLPQRITALLLHGEASLLKATGDAGKERLAGAAAALDMQSRLGEELWQQLQRHAPAAPQSAGAAAAACDGGQVSRELGSAGSSSGAGVAAPQ